MQPAAASDRALRRIDALKRWLIVDEGVSQEQQQADGSLELVKTSTRLTNGAAVEQAGKARGSKEVALIVGAGDGLGAAVARRFAQEGYVACLARRNGDKLSGLVESIKAEGGEAHAFSCDARKEEAVQGLVTQIEQEVGPIAACVFNVGANVRFPILDTTERVYRKVWEMAALAAFLVGREVARVMVPRGKGTILFTGATASTRGRSGFSAFAGAKAAKRQLAQSMARELGPKGIHVAHIVVDGPIDGPFIRNMFPDLVKEHEGERYPRLLQPDDIAHTFYAVHCQPKSAWSFELDVRPWTEPW